MKKLFKILQFLRGLQRRDHRGYSSLHGHWRPRSRAHDYYPLASRRSRLSSVLRALFARRGY